MIKPGDLLKLKLRNVRLTTTMQLKHITTRRGTNEWVCDPSRDDVIITVDQVMLAIKKTDKYWVLYVAGAFVEFHEIDLQRV
jgi:uncharacterized protein with PhoU and TrkA domain